MNQASPALRKALADLDGDLFQSRGWFERFGRPYHLPALILSPMFSPGRSLLPACGSQSTMGWSSPRTLPPA